MAKNTKFGSYFSRFGLFALNAGRRFFLKKKNLVPSVSRYHGQLSSCIISEKTNNPILRKWRTDGKTDRQTDRKMDKSDFIGRSPLNFERPKYQNLSTVTFISCSLEIHFVCKIQSNIECKYTKNFVVCFELEQKLFSYSKFK